MSDNTAFSQARQAIDQLHAEDPKKTTEGQPAELVYADRMEHWLTLLQPEASPLLRLAARCQHLQRWSVPRASFPLDKVGYHAWRKSLYTKQASLASELLLASGLSTEQAAEVFTWVSKTGLKDNPGTQALEDAACLVFFVHEIPGFAALHPDYTKEKYLTILSKTWRKMSKHAQETVLSLELPPDISALLKEAI